MPQVSNSNDLAHRVPLNGVAREILASLPSVSPWVFPSPEQGQHMHRNAIAMALRRARVRAKSPLTVSNFSPHDLRRTAASHMASAGVERFVVGRLLNHVESGVTRVYDRHSYDAEKQKATTMWERLLRAILADATRAEVVSIR